MALLAVAVAVTGGFDWCIQFRDDLGWKGLDSLVADLTRKLRRNGNGFQLIALTGGKGRRQ